RTNSGFTLADSFIFISMLLYGTYASVIVAGLDAAACSLKLRDRRGLIVFNSAAMSLSIFISGSLVSFTFGDLRLLASQPTQLVLAAGMLAIIHMILTSVLMTMAAAHESHQSLSDTWKGISIWASISAIAGAISACIIVKLITVI